MKGDGVLYLVIMIGISRTIFTEASPVQGAFAPGYLDPYVAVGAGAAPQIAPNLLTGAQAPVTGPAPEGKPTFWWGVATAAYQIEGGAHEGGKGLSIWDTFSHTPGKIHMGGNGDVTDDFYHRYRDDIDMMRKLGVRNFRMSVAWARIFPNGTGDQPNAAGLQYYSDVIDALLAAGIQPLLTLYHWDLPQALQDRYGGWNDSRVVDDFRAYAAVVFGAFGTRVTYWTTFNEPNIFCFHGYGANASHAPGMNSDVAAWNCAYHVLLAHAAAAAEFRTHVQGGRISMNINMEWGQPWSNDPRDQRTFNLFPSTTGQEAAEVKMAMHHGMFSDPLYFGDWPEAVIERVPYLKRFTPEQAASLSGTVDYFAINFYFGNWVQHVPGTSPMRYRELVSGPHGLIGPVAESTWLKATPWAFRKMLSWINDRYAPSEIVCTENGVDVPGEYNMPLAQVLNDTFRVNFLRDYIQQGMLAVSEDNINLTGYTIWALYDNFEWAEGYNARFGIVAVDYATGKRYPKESARFVGQYFGTTPGATSD